jgi:CheY-like chemotaxis protein
MSDPKKRILVVEDKKEDAELTRRTLIRSKLPCDIETVSNGKEALEYLNEKGVLSAPDFSQLPHLILLDLNMPKMGGLPFLEIIQENPVLKLIPIIVFTTSDKDNDVINSYLSGAVNYVQKPLTVEKLQGVLFEIGLDWLGEPPEALRAGRSLRKK